MRSFQRCLRYCTRIRWQFLHTFADAYQGCYKNGTNGTCDYRYFAVLYLFFCMVLLALITFAGRYLWLILLLSVVVASLSFAYFRPYKNNYFNIIDCLGCGLLALVIFLIMYESTEPFPIQLLFVLSIIPLLYFISFILYKTISQVALFRTCYSRIVDIGSQQEMKTSTFTFREVTTLMRIPKMTLNHRLGSISLAEPDSHTSLAPRD